MEKNKIVKKILLIEDSEYSQIQIKEALENFPVDIILKNTAEDALIFLNEHKEIDLLLIDIGLPKMNGVEFLEKLSKSYPYYNNIPKIAVTAHVMKTEMDNYIGKGFSSIISKPFKLQHFREVISSSLKLSNQISSKKDV